MELKVINKDVNSEKKKRGPKPKNDLTGGIDNREQYRFVIDLSRDEKEREFILGTIKEANNKTYGREINLKDLIFLVLTKINPKDIEKLKESSLTEMEKVQRLLDDHNKKNNCDLSMGEWLVKRLNIN